MRGRFDFHTALKQAQQPQGLWLAQLPLSAFMAWKAVGTVKFNLTPPPAFIGLDGFRITGSRSGYPYLKEFQVELSDYARDSVYQRFKYGQANLNGLGRIISYARTQGIDLRLFISPIHALQSELIHQMGLGKQLQRWRRDLVLLTAGHNTTPAIPLFDFGGYNRYTTEPVPTEFGPMAGKSMRWYWESSHYKKELGDRLLDRIFQGKEASRDSIPEPDAFGVLLEKRMLERHFHSQDQTRAQFQKDHPDQITLLKNLLHETEKQITD